MPETLVAAPLANLLHSTACSKGDRRRPTEALSRLGRRRQTAERDPRVSTLVRLATALDVEPSTLLGGVLEDADD